MKTYKIVRSEWYYNRYPGLVRYLIKDASSDALPAFAGYDFMGGAVWTEDIKEAYFMTMEEARNVLSDLEKAE